MPSWYVAIDSYGVSVGIKRGIVTMAPWRYLFEDRVSIFISTNMDN
jgi:hypothetical protein